jgi:hypothetical protein
VGEDRPKTERRGTADQPADRTELVIAELQDHVRFLEEANRANRRIIEALTSRIPAMESSHEPPDAAETDGEAERSVASEVLGPKAILFRFSLGLLLVSGAAVFDAYMYDDPAFGPLVRVLPVTLLAAGAFGVYAGYTAGIGRDFR